MTMVQVVDDTQILEDQKTNLFHVRVVVLCFLMLFLDGIDNLGIAYMAPALSQAWRLGKGALGPVPEVPEAVHSSHLCSRRAEKALLFTPVWESSGESRV